VETNDERRLRKLKGLCEDHGGPAGVAEKSGLKAVYLEQILKGVLLPPKRGGDRSRRSLGDPAARAIEDKFGLGRGWFDNDELEGTMTPSELLMLGYFRKLDPEAQDRIVHDLQKLVEGRANLLNQMRRDLGQPTQRQPSLVGEPKAPAKSRRKTTK
jgi:hypothetical protein